MNVFSKGRVIGVAATLSLLGALLFVPPRAFAQGAVEDCIQQGFKPGTAGFYHCLQSAGGGERDDAQMSVDSDADSNTDGDPDGAVTDFSGSTMEGATSPDPDILKQLNTGPAPGR